MPSLTMKNHLGVVTATIARALRLAFLKRYTPVADLTTLALPATLTARADGGLVYVTGEGCCFEWVLASTVAHDGVAVIQVAGVAQGRWHRVTSAMTYGPNINAMLAAKQTGWAKAVLVHEGQTTIETLTEQTIAQAPALQLEFTGDQLSRDKAAARSGRYYWNYLSYTLFVTSKNLRLPKLFPWALLQSPFAADDPSLTDMIGDLRYFLAGLDTYVDGIEYVEIGDFDIVEEDLDERIICGTLVFRVKVSVGIPDEDLEDLRVDVQPKLTQSAQVAIFDDVPFDPLNFVAKGFGCAVGPGFFRSFGPSTDLVTVGGVAVASPSASVTLAADSDIWRDADATGALYFTVVAHDETPPAAATGRLRIGRTVTDSTGVVRDDFVCSRSVDMGAPFTVP